MGVDWLSLRRTKGCGLCATLGMCVVDLGPWPVVTAQALAVVERRARRERTLLQERRLSV